MDTVEKIWMDGKFVDWKDANVHVLSHALHYGSGVFEGIRFYKTKTGPVVFRLKEHIERLYYSGKFLRLLPEYKIEEVEEAVLETIRINKVDQGYIRPLLFYGYGKMGLNPKGADINLVIAVWPWGKYLAKDKIKVKVTKYIRIHPDSTHAQAKITGHYVNSILSNIEATEKGYDEALILDYEGNVAEGPGENIFLVEKGKLVTPPANHILPGITRSSILEMANDMGLEASEETISHKRLLMSDELFFTGTAAEITPIFKIDDWVIGEGEIGPITNKLMDEFNKVVTGEDPKYNKWLTRV
ncbi:branched-chain amino acid transaminase [Candidatus Woesearchaeota archaeon]|nr:branched-chain amino acid transaminase [Candidatus Woesearchaeota archaeon]